MPYSGKNKLSNQAHRMLGVRLAPNGSWAAELEFLQNKIRRFNAHLTKRFLNNHKVIVAMRTRFEPSVCYSSGITSFSPSQCDQLQKLIHPAWLCALGYSSRYPSAVAYAPEWIGGIWMLQFCVHQGTRGLEMMLGHLWAETEVRRMVKIGIDYFRLIAGHSTCPFANPTIQTAYSITDWYTMIREFLLSTNSSVIIPMPGYFLPKSQGDTCLMDRAVPPQWARLETRAINRCRLYLQVLFISNITHGDGKNSSALHS